MLQCFKSGPVRTGYQDKSRQPCAKPSLFIRFDSFALCIFVPLLSFLSTGASTKSSRQELLARTPLHRLIITKGLRKYDAYSRISLSVMIVPSEPSISLRSCSANNSKGRCKLEVVRETEINKGYGHLVANTRDPDLNRKNPPLKEVSADWRTEDVVRFISSETVQHPSDLTQVFDRSPFEGRFRIFASILSPNLVHSPTPLCSLWLKQFPAFPDPNLVLPLTLGRKTYFC